MRITDYEKNVIGKARELGYRKYHKVVEELAELVGGGPADWEDTFVVGKGLRRRVGMVARNLSVLTQEHPEFMEKYGYGLDTEKVYGGFKLGMRCEMSPWFVIRVSTEDTPAVEMPKIDFRPDTDAKSAVGTVAFALLQVVNMKIMVELYNRLLKITEDEESNESIQRAKDAEEAMSSLEDF